MTYFDHSNHIQYDEWFHNNIDPCELEIEMEKNFSSSVHEKFYKISEYNLIINSSESVSDSQSSNRCSGGFCSLTNEELEKL